MLVWPSRGSRSSLTVRGWDGGSQIANPTACRKQTTAWEGRQVKYGVVRNGILLHGPRGGGKTFLAEATAGEFDLNYYYLSSPALLNM